MLMADDLHDSFPLLEKDMYFGESAPECLPYTKSSISSLKAPFMGSTASLRYVLSQYRIFVTFLNTFSYITMYAVDFRNDVLITLNVNV